MVRSKFIKAGSLLVRFVATLALTLLFARWFGTVTFAPCATDLLIRMSTALGIYGDEAIEDFYMYSTATLSLIAAIVIVVLAHRWWKRRVRIELQ